MDFSHFYFWRHIYRKETLVRELACKLLNIFSKTRKYKWLIALAYTSDQWNPHLNFDYRNTHVEKRTKIKYCWLSRVAVWMSFLWWIPESPHYSFCPGNKAAKHFYNALTINPSLIHSSHGNHSIQGQDVFKVMILIWWRELAVLPYSPSPFFKWIVANE